LRAAAQDFEAIFLHQMLKSMRQSLPVGGPLAPGSGQKMVQDMLDDEMARAMARVGGLGLADVLVRDLIRHLPGAKNPSSPGASEPISRGERRGSGEGGAR
jgi:Rod binding domain-containing protein